MDIKKLGTGIDCCKRICLYAVFTFQGRSCTSYKGWRDIPGMQYRKCRIYTDKLCGEDRFF